RGCLPTGNAWSCVAPATGRLMLANWPPLGWSQVHTCGGTYSLLSVMKVPSFLQPALQLGTFETPFQCQRLYRADGEEARHRTVPIGFEVLDDRRAIRRKVWLGRTNGFGFRLRSPLGLYLRSAFGFR